MNSKPLKEIALKYDKIMFYYQLSQKQALNPKYLSLNFNSVIKLTDQS